MSIFGALMSAGKDGPCIVAILIAVTVRLLSTTSTMAVPIQISPSLLFHAITSPVWTKSSMALQLITLILFPPAVDCLSGSCLPVP